MKVLIALSVSIILFLACGGHEGASAAVVNFAQAISDSSYSEAWALLTPDTQHWYDSTAVVLHRFGWTESRQAVTELAGEMTEEEFLALTGKDIFTRMVSGSQDVHDLSTSIKSVTYPDSLVGVVVVRTDEGLQEVIVRKIGEEWLVDLTGLAPPVEGG